VTGQPGGRLKSDRAEFQPDIELPAEIAGMC
jgi:hypothetical protein